MHISNIHEAKAGLSQLIKRAMAGEEVIIAKAGEPLIRLVPIATDPSPRQGNQWKGQIWIADDFDAPDPELETLFHDRPI
jgi:prevent-host-death family protein